MFRTSFRTSNPVFRSVSKHEGEYSDYQTTYKGVLFKLAILIGAAILSAFGTLIPVTQGIISLESYVIILLVAVVVGFISCIIGCFATKTAMIWSLIYSMAEGVSLGYISAIYTVYVGNLIVPVALASTLAVALIMLLLYASGIIKVNHKFRAILITSLIVVMITSIIMIFLPIDSTFMFIYIGVSFISALIASLYLAVDYDNISKCVDAGVAKTYEWRLAMSLMVTLVWLYVEILRIVAFFARFANRN